MKTYKRIGAARHTAKILKLLANESDPVLSNLIAEKTGMSYSNAMSYLVTLEDEGFVRSIGGKWELGFAVTLIREAIKRKFKSQIAEAQVCLDMISSEEN